MKILLGFALVFLCYLPATAHPAGELCPRPKPGSVVSEPADLRSTGGTLKLELTLHGYKGKDDGSQTYCYLYQDGSEAPNLRLSPGDSLILSLKNEVGDGGLPKAATMEMGTASHQSEAGACTPMEMKSTNTNLHFHGINVPSICHQDDVLHTMVGVGDPPFEYRFQVPSNQPPGLYWYHPHIHGFTKAQVLGGASGALIIEGIERANKNVAGLPERVFVIRDRDLVNPNAPPSKSEPVVPKMLFDTDGDAANTGTGFGKPAKDLSINFVPAPYPDYQPAVIEMRPTERQLWRVLNASAITYLNLEVLFNRAPQQLGLVALDGVPLNENGKMGDYVDWENHFGIPPGGRVEFIVNGPAIGTEALLVTKTVDTGPGGENDPNRTIAIIKPLPNATDPRSVLNAAPKPMPPATLPWLGSVAPVRVRRLYFSEKLLDPNNPNSATEFYITVDGQKPAPFDPQTGIPNITANQGDVEDWVIENRSNELHAFHIHQLHFMLLQYMGNPVSEPFLRDTINVPYYDGRALVYPSVTLRMDFRDPNTVGTFVYHCHLLEHEDNGMMGLIRVNPAAASTLREGNSVP
jgi:FtsP/CotA-like multicopper oxidase with cupredoxin domain